MENEEPSRDEAAEQKARGEENKEKAEQLLEPYRQRKILAINPSLFLGMLSAYLFFIAGVGAFGVLAYYSNHRTTLEVSFVISGVLLLLAPASAVWYLLYIRSKKKVDGKEKLLLRITRSSLGGLLVRFGNSRVIRILVYAVYLVSITLFVTLVFPRSPRIALLLTIFYMLYLVGLTISLVAASLEKKHRKDTTTLADATVAIYEVIKAQEIELNYFKDTEPGHVEMHTSIGVALRAIHRTLELMANPVNTTQQETPIAEDDIETDNDRDPK